MKKFYWIIWASVLLLCGHGCLQDEVMEDVMLCDVEREQLNLPKHLEDYGKKVANVIKFTVAQMVEKGVDYSDLPDSTDFRKIFFSDWCRINAIDTCFHELRNSMPSQMSASDFAENYRSLTDLQIEFIKKIVAECEQSKSFQDLLFRLVNVRNDVYLQIPEIERERILRVISVLYYGIQEIMHLDEQGLILITPFSYHSQQLVSVKTRTEYVLPSVPSYCRVFLTTIWNLAVGEPTLAGEVVASVMTVWIAGEMFYEVITCLKSSDIRQFCQEKYNDCMEYDSKWNKEHSGGWGATMCSQCYVYCLAQGIWDCPRF